MPKLVRMDNVKPIDDGLAVSVMKLFIGRRFSVRCRPENIGSRSDAWAVARSSSDTINLRAKLTSHRCVSNIANGVPNEVDC
jgi:hypothetical protein